MTKIDQRNILFSSVNSLHIRRSAVCSRNLTIIDSIKDIRLKSVMTQYMKRLKTDIVF